MKINNIKRPWVQSYKPRKYEPFYHTQQWRNIRKAFMLGTTTLEDGRIVPNNICIMCYLEGKTVAANTIDHKHRIKDGGDALDPNNLQALCRQHHDRKSSSEGHEMKEKMKKSN